MNNKDDCLKLHHVGYLINRVMMHGTTNIKNSLTPDALCPSRLSRAHNSDKYNRLVTLTLVAKIVAVCAIGGFLPLGLIIKAKVKVKHSRYRPLQAQRGLGS